MAKYLIEKGLDPKEAIEITIDKYKNTKVNIERLEKKLRKELKRALYDKKDLSERQKDELWKRIIAS